MIRYNSHQLKHLAKKSLSAPGVLTKFLLVYLLYFIISNTANSILTSVTGINSLIDYETGTLAPNFSVSTLAIFLISTYILSLILSVLDLGFNKMFLLCSREQEFSWEMLFYGFKNQPDRVLIFQLIIGGLSLGALLPGYLLILLSNQWKLHWILVIIGLVLLLVGLIPSYYFTLIFSQGMFLLAEHETMGAVEALRQSHRLMKGHKMRYFLLTLSFLPLQVLCYMTCNFGTFLLYPFMGMTHAFFYRNIIGEIGEHDSVLYY